MGMVTMYRCGSEGFRVHGHILFKNNKQERIFFLNEQRSS